RNGWVGRIALLGSTVSLFLTSCMTTNVVVSSAPAPQAQQTVASDEDDFSQLMAQLQADLNRQKSREVVRTPTMTSTATTTKERNREFAARAAALFAPLSSTSLRMPVVGIRTYDISDSWGNSRDGGKRKHRGIDIFAKRGTPIVAVTDGIVSYIGDQPKGGHCLWLTTESGASFYYAHLDRWAPGLYEGMEVQSGDLLGYVGNTGNAVTTPPHLHFGVNQNDEMVNPYPILTRAVFVAHAQVHTEAGGGLGTR
ncbi:MAG TPA: M23 family metallopeptidase, partial [Thermoanaerobaculia bacterium]|nr:M23 family metallopeptidase [Thermoanaerobaculia bacterium]